MSTKSDEIEIEVIENEESKDDTSKWSFRKNIYATSIVLLILLVRMTNQWHRKSLTYAFGFSMPEGFPLDQRSIYEISASYP